MFGVFRSRLSSLSSSSLLCSSSRLSCPSSSLSCSSSLVSPSLFSCPFSSSSFSLSASPSPTVPVTILSGFLGAGKTTLLNHILHDRNHNKKIAVLVNDMAEVNIDADIVKDSGGLKDGEEERKMVQLENGCICCTLRDDLVLELAGLAKQGEIEHIVVESTGVSEPLPIAQTFSAKITPQQTSDAQATTTTTNENENVNKFDAIKGLSTLNDIAHLHSLVTVVDCSTFLDHLESLENLTQLGMATREGDTRPLAFLLAEQVQFANLILLNKTDLVSEKEVKKIKSLLSHLNPTAEIVPTQQSQLDDVEQFLSNRSYDEDTFSKMPAWAEELAKSSQKKTPQSETEEYGISHFTLRLLARPFHPERWHKLLREEGATLFDGVLRAKGCFWTLAEPDTRIDFSLVGKSANLIVNTVWCQVGLDMVSKSSLTLRNVDEEDQKKKAIEAAQFRLSHKEMGLKEQQLWHPVTHDRRIELVFIGDKERMDEKKLRNAIEGALATKEELEEFFEKFGKKKTQVDQTNPFANVPRCIVL